jgi:hypothetical protein
MLAFEYAEAGCDRSIAGAIEKELPQSLLDRVDLFQHEPAFAANVRDWDKLERALEGLVARRRTMLRLFGYVAKADAAEAQVVHCFAELGGCLSFA